LRPRNPGSLPRIPSPMRGEGELRARNLRNMSDEELDEKLHETRQELFNLRFQSATGALENSARVRLAKREIARILTVIHEREAELESTA
jgi:large subunit ribosomal protein L29